MEKDELHYFQPIRLIVDPGTNDVVINCVEDAADELLGNWPDNDSDRFYAGDAF